MPTRAEHRRETLRRLSDAAVEAFEADGPGVTIERIAERAGLSRRTVFRYVDAKEELAFVHPILWFDVFDAALRRHAELPFTERLRRSSRAIADHIDAEPEPPRRAFLAAAAHPELTRGFTAVFQRWIDRVAELVIDEVGPTDDPSVHFRARIVGAAVMGMVDAVTRQWVVSPPETRFADIYDEGFAVLAPLLADLEAGIPRERPVT